MSNEQLPTEQGNSARPASGRWLNTEADRLGAIPQGAAYEADTRDAIALQAIALVRIGDELENIRRLLKVNQDRRS